ncbi:serine/threonine-protein kinase MHK-like [Camellia sinensis]|uniref:serine/threonine-protein kinase MHK-like n=1 Tax=Camellia sinensis TaxID=4442 RepID=UPI001035F82E|nr:serine/threonine-protein kinase MHK-like [Camellia sinensis]
MVVKSAEVSDSAMLQREDLVLRNFHTCPYIYRCFDDVIMPAKAKTLADLISKNDGRGFPESDVRRYTRHILEGLDCVHSSGYVHRALKPENIIIAPVSLSTRTETNYVAKNGDFGLANTKKQMMTTSKSYKLRGNIRYLSPKTVVDRGLQQETPSSNV